MVNLNCPSCGAPIAIKNRFSKVVVCDYCGTHHAVENDELSPKGKFTKISEYPSLLKLGMKGTILDKPFEAMGRMRYLCDGAHYDEWFLDYEGDVAWFTEDEGTFTLYTEIAEAVDLEDIGSLKPGQNITVGDRRVMIKEKGTASVESCEGELFYYVEPGTEVTYIDGVADGKKVSIESSEDEVEMFVGRPLMRRHIQIEE